MPCGREPVPVTGQTQRKVVLTGIKPTLAAAREAGAR